MFKGQAGWRTRSLSRSKPARPYICRFSSFSRWTPSTMPLLHGSRSAASTAFSGDSGRVNEAQRLLALARSKLGQAPPPNTAPESASTYASSRSTEQTGQIEAQFASAENETAAARSAQIPANNDPSAPVPADSRFTVGISRLPTPALSSSSNRQTPCLSRTGRNRKTSRVSLSFVRRRIKDRRMRRHLQELPECKSDSATQCP